MSEIKHTPVTDDTFIMGYKVGAGLYGTRAEAEKAIRRGEGSSWIPLYRENHAASDLLEALRELLTCVELENTDGVDEDRIDAAQDAARAVIAKVTGSQS
ncbi:hypothetical protein [Paraburkholderia sediminicola]|uniref:hypothetical protein n=1 Tax=Paraburkholderia sediminicola TaxID=458836 RepID=UPI0038BE1103